VNGSVPDKLPYSPLVEQWVHTVRMTRYLDIDFVCCLNQFCLGILTRSVIVDCIPNTNVGQADEALLVTTVQDTDRSFKYIPEQQWNTNPENSATFSEGSGQYVLFRSITIMRSVPDNYFCSVTSTPGASVEFTFKVSACRSRNCCHSYKLQGRASSCRSLNILAS
jgi:hypothetical protein